MVRIALLISRDGLLIVIARRMCYRASSLFKIPIPALVKLLGLDLPDPPLVSLHGIAADTITLHWSLPEKAGSVAKHIIQINGINGKAINHRCQIPVG